MSRREACHGGQYVVPRHVKVTVMSRRGPVKVSHVKIGITSRCDASQGESHVKMRTCQSESCQGRDHVEVWRISRWQSCQNEGLSESHVKIKCIKRRELRWGSCQRVSRFTGRLLSRWEAHVNIYLTLKWSGRLNECHVNDDVKDYVKIMLKWLSQQGVGHVSVLARQMTSLCTSYHVGCHVSSLQTVSVTSSGTDGHVRCRKVSYLIIERWIGCSCLHKSLRFIKPNGAIFFLYSWLCM